MKKLIFLFLAVVLSGCSHNSNNFEVYLDSFISAYYDYSDVDIKVNDAGQILVCPIVSHIYSADSSAENDRLRFQELAQLNGDVAFNQKVVFTEPVKYPNLMSAESLVKIELNALDGSEEPVSLNSQVKFKAVTPREFIRNGYTKQAQTEMPDYTNGEMELCYNSIVKMADTLSADDLELIGNGEMWYYILFVLQFTEQPQSPLELELVLTFADNRVIRKTFEYTYK